jgi:hypothetical protein
VGCQGLRQALVLKVGGQHHPQVETAPASFPFELADFAQRGTGNDSKGSVAVNL